MELKRIRQKKLTATQTNLSRLASLFSNTIWAKIDERQMKIFKELGFLTKDRALTLNLTADNERLVDYLGTKPNSMQQNVCAMVR
jgi:TRAP-type C4-dicarboxylate transport system substrate-binding protein